MWFLNAKEVKVLVNLFIQAFKQYPNEVLDR